MSVIIIGKKGFVAKNVYNYLKRKKTKILITSLNNFFTLESKKLKKYRNIINCSINNETINSKYSPLYDLDRQICEKIKNLNIRFIFLSTRKVYGDKFYPTETAKVKPLCNYSKNKVISENFCNEILKKKLIILRITNLVGYREHSKKRLHKTFMDYFLMNIKKKKITFNYKDYKDFISIEQFSDVIYRICKNSNIHGIYNVSLGKKVFLIDLIKALLKNCRTKVTITDNKKLKSDNFVINNKKLLNTLKIDLKENKLIDYCHNLSKKIN
tara:strand:- start:9305 stop:10114 length:810 start_codon:yes stop_codon:yes gene_type:complete